MTRKRVPAGRAGLLACAVALFGTLRGATAQSLDFGDAPDAPYPTVLASNGARHAIIPGAPWLGDPSDVPDPEPNGQPDPNALGDDKNGTSPDDEDGVAVPNPLAVGVPATINVTVGGSGGWLDAWVDWNGNGAWEAGESIYSGAVTPGILAINVTAPGPYTGQTFARFRIWSSPQGMPLAPTGFADDGEVEDHEVWIEEGETTWKWRQPPDLTPQGFDVECMQDRPILLADDFLCREKSTITNIVVWASWLSDEVPMGQNGPDPSNVVFTLSFHADVPKGVQAPWSMPGQTLWWTTFAPGSYRAEPYVENIHEGWYDPATTNWTPNADWTCWKYTFPVDPTMAFVQTGSVDNAVTYWLDVQAQPLADPFVRFGWKTTRPEYRWNDDACWAPATEPYGGFWWDLRYPPGHPYHQWETNSVDLAFMLFGGPVEQEDEFDWGDAPDPSYPTLAANGGASHLISSAGPWLGLVFPDAEADGQPTPLADGDDVNPIAAPDDEDGVVFPAAAMTIGYPENIVVNVSGAAAGTYYVDGWIDWNQSGAWGDDPTEQVVSGTFPVGTMVFSVAPPAGIAVAGPTYARFRVNSFGALGPTGAAADGEVEDYLVMVDEPDLGDAPDPAYPTLIASNGALHKIAPGPWLGGPLDLPDPEPDGQPDPNAMGDDVLDGNDDENGVVFAQLIAGQTTVVQVAVGNATGGGGFVDAWIDWNGDGIWQNPAERIIGAPLPFGVNPVPVLVPAGATNGWTFARFRISNQGGLPPVGPAPDGEVEDYEVYLDVADFGDAPGGGPFVLRYPTLLVDTGAWHVVTSSLFLGAAVDGEFDGQPTPLADGDDLTPPAGPDDEDGVVFLSGLYPGVPASVQVTAVGAGLLSVWLDGNADGDWDDFGEQVLIDVPLAPGVNNLVYNVPFGTMGPTTMRFRYSTQRGLGVRGGAPDGEVEDYAVTIADEVYAFDYGDADGVYPVMLGQNGARHVDPGTTTYIMGTLLDADADGQPTAAADGDDTVLLDDEDGVLFPLDNASNPVLVQGSNMTVKVVTPGAPWLSAWVDYNGDGDWNDAGETIAAAVALSAGTNNLPVTAPVGSYLGPTYARFRTSSLATPLATTGPAPDGEVEDYLLTLCQPAPSSPVTLVITNFAVVTNLGAVMVWDCDPALWTRPQACTNLVEASTNAAVWTSLTGLGTVRQYTDGSATNRPVRFYRVAAPYVYP